MSSNNFSPEQFGGSGNVTPNNPNEQLGFEITPPKRGWNFTPDFYPGDFTQMKKKELSRYGGNCGGESVSIKSIKNREFHVTGEVVRYEISTLQKLMDYSGVVDLISPLTPIGGMECYVKKVEIGSEEGWDPHKRQRTFTFTIDLVSTGRDEYNNGRNSVVTAILSEDPPGEQLEQAVDSAQDYASDRLSGDESSN